MSFQTIITNLGAARIAAAIQGGGVVNLSHMALGDGGGNVTTPNANQSALVREVYRAELNHLTRSEANPNYVIAEMVVPSDVGGWSIREVGLYDNGGNLIAVGNFPETYKPQLSEGSARDLVVRFIIEVSTNAIIALQIDPAVVLATRQWVDENFSLAILLPGGATGQVLRKKSNQNGDVEWYDPASGLNLLVDIVEENQNLADSQAIVDLLIATMESTAVYVNGVRLRNDGTQYTVGSNTQITLAAPATSGDKITFVQNEPAGAVEFLRSANNLQELSAPDRAAQARANLGVQTSAQMLTAVLGALFPVGEIWMTNRVGNPASLLGFGTWERHGKGRTPVSLDPDDATFSTLGATGGSKTHTISITETPTHFHEKPTQNVSTTSNGDHAHGYKDRYYIERSDVVSGAAQSLPSGGVNSGAGSHGTDTDNNTFLYVNSVTENAGPHIHSVTIPASNTGTAGGGQPHNNMQPYIVVNIWRRVA